MASRRDRRPGGLDWIPGAAKRKNPRGAGFAAAPPLSLSGRSPRGQTTSKPSGTWTWLGSRTHPKVKTTSLPCPQPNHGLPGWRSKLLESTFEHTRPDCPASFPLLMDPPFGEATVASSPKATSDTCDADKPRNFKGEPFKRRLDGERRGTTCHQFRFQPAIARRRNRSC